LINAQNVIRAQSIESYVRSILREVVALPGGGSALRFDVRPMYNPTFETSVYMVPGVMCMLLCIVTILLTSMSLAREKEMGTLETLISAPVRSWEIVIGKTLPYVMLGMLQIPLILSAAVLLFGIPVRGPIIMLLVAGFFFVVTTVSIGLLISTLAGNQQQAMLGGFLFLFPAVLLSGLMFPIENMPLAMWLVAQVNPMTHFIGLLRNILLKGGSLDYFLTHASVLALSGAAFSFAAMKRFKTTV
jgi:ABC-2 type transport system permease protein